MTTTSLHQRSQSGPWRRRPPVALQADRPGPALTLAAFIPDRMTRIVALLLAIVLINLIGVRGQASSTGNAGSSAPGRGNWTSPDGMFTVAWSPAVSDPTGSMTFVAQCQVNAGWCAVGFNTPNSQGSMELTDLYLGWVGSNPAVMDMFSPSTSRPAPDTIVCQH